MSKTEELEELPGIEIRYTEMADGKYLREWLLDPNVNRWFPMVDTAEAEDATNRWIGFARWRCSLTATRDGVPIGITTLYLQPYKKLAHQCEFGIIVSDKERGKGVGTYLLKSLMALAKETFKIELLHLQVYAGNPATRLYERLGFKEFGRQNEWIKELDGSYTARIFMEKNL
ncbi:MAG: GNAT family N-acetyltransferase [Chlamydiia bacterium]|nr:GNAT family N-acetyltransferase [Chlamydiia bacterium]